MKQKKLTPRKIMNILTGFFFALYSAYNVFIIIRDFSALPSEGLFISAVVALIFALFAAYVWTAGVKKKNALFRMIRRTVFILALFAIFVLKARMIDRVIQYINSFMFETVFFDGEKFDFSMLPGVLFGASYFFTLAAMLLLIIYFLFIRKRILLFPRASVVLPVIAMLLFIGSLILDMILCLGYGISLEANMKRTLVIRPVFYLGLIGMCAYCL